VFFEIRTRSSHRGPAAVAQLKVGQSGGSAGLRHGCECGDHSLFSDQISDRDVVRRGGTPGVTRACKTGSSGENGDEWDVRPSLGCGPLSS
jgi:hypothetical protein